MNRVGSFEQGVLNSHPFFVSIQCVLENVLADLNEVMLKGGLIRVNGINVLFDYDTNLNYYGSTTGYHITNSLGYKVYFKCRERSKAQETADIIFGKNQYRVQAKV